MTRSRRACLAAALLALALGLPGCGGDRTQAKSSTVAPPVSEARAAAGSLYDLDLQLTDLDGRRVALRSLNHHVLVAAMMYTSCKSVCPRVTEDMKGVERQLAGKSRERVRFVLFSLDPGRDTPGALRAFAQDHRLDTDRWRLFAASADDVRELAAVLGVKYRPEAGGQIAHSAMIFVIDRGGIVRHRQVGLNEDPHDLVAAVERAR